MLIRKGYIIPEDELTIFEKTDDIIKLVDKNYDTTKASLIYYATYNDGDMMFSPERNIENIVEKCKNARSRALLEEEKEILFMFNIDEENEFTDFDKAYEYLKKHPIFNNCFLDCIDLQTVDVNPNTDEIDENEELNTKMQIWIECGPYQKDCLTHDINLDCGGDTIEDATINLANLVRLYYGDNEEIALKKVKKKYG